MDARRRAADAGDLVDYTPRLHAQHRPEAPAIVMGMSGETVSYAELEDRSRHLAAALRARGIGEGQHIAILLENTRAYLEVAWAAQRSGLYYTAINSHLRQAEVQYILDDCAAEALFTSPGLSEVVAGLDLSRIGVKVALGHGLESLGFESYDDVLAEASPEHAGPDCEGREMLYSSGTTGRPKGVRKELPGTPFGDRSATPVQLAMGIGALGAGPDSVYLSPAPLYHAAPLVYSMSMQRLGATVVVMERFDARQCLDLIDRYRVTHAQFVPTMFARLLQLPREERTRYDLSSLQFAVHAAAPCPVPIKRQMLDWWGPIIHEYYSGTEDIGSTHITPQEWLAHPGSVGRPVEECHVVDDSGEEVPAGQSGVIYFVGGHAFEYHNDPGKTASVANDRGWRTLGDIGYLDGDGCLYLTDRQAHMIISGGVNIYPQEAENTLAAHPAVSDVAVIGVPDEEMGEAVKAVVRPVDLSAAGPALERELLAFCRSELASFKCPRSVDFVPELPRDPNGKLYKRRLREEYWRGHSSLVG